MDAIVEVETAKAAAQTAEVTVVTRVIPFVEVAAPVATSTLHTPVISLGSHSISAIAPDAHTSERTLALA